MGQDDSRLTLSRDELMTIVASAIRVGRPHDGCGDYGEHLVLVAMMQADERNLTGSWATDAATLPYGSDGIDALNEATAERAAYCAWVDQLRKDYETLAAVTLPTDPVAHVLGFQGPGAVARGGATRRRLVCGAAQCDGQTRCSPTGQAGVQRLPAHLARLRNPWRRPASLDSFKCLY